MTHEELMRFKKEVADPRMREIFARTEIPEGMCCIDRVAIGFLDGRSCGVDSLIEATGLKYCNGKVTEYQYSETDVSVAEFVNAHKGCFFISDGALRVYDEVDRFQVNTEFWNHERCAKVFDGLECLEKLDFHYQSMEFEKMKAIFEGSPLVQDGIREDEPVTLMNAAAIEYKGIIFDDWNADSEGVWANICQCCAEKYKDLISGELDDSAIGICSVAGCEVRGLETENEHHYYIDFDPELIRPLSKEQLAELQSKSLENQINGAKAIGSKQEIEGEAVVPQRPER